MSSPFDRQAVDELDALDVGAFKIASFELVDLPFIRYAAACRRPLILSTGMASLGEIEEALSAAREAGCDEIALLQCASLYPAPAHVMNLRSIPVMQAAFGVPVGLSDHTQRHPHRGRGGCAGRVHRREALHARPHDARPRSPVRGRAAGAARPRRAHPRHGGRAGRRRQARAVAGRGGGDVRQGAALGRRRDATSRVERSSPRTC